MMQDNPEGLFRGTRRDNPVTTPSGLKVTWYHNQTAEGRTATQRPTVEFPAAEKAVANHIAAVGVNLFENNLLLPDTLKNLTGRSDLPKNLAIDGVLANAGIKSLILAYRTNIDGDPYYFITALSPAPQGGRLDRDLRDDFRNLSRVSQRAQAVDLAKIQPNLEITQPLGIGETTFGGRKHRAFTMIYLPYPELNVSLVKDRVVLRYSPNMNQPDPEQQSITRRIQRLAEEEAGRALTDTHMKDLMRASVMVYLLADESFPMEHGVAHGDWVGSINMGGRLDKVGLTTLRGGLDKMSSRQFVDHLRKHVINVGAKSGKPFERFSVDEIMATIDELRPSLSETAVSERPWWKFW